MAITVAIALPQPLVAMSVATVKTVIATDAATTVNIPADHLFLAVEIEARGDTPPETIPVRNDLAIVARRLARAGIPAATIVESVLREVPQRYRGAGSIVDPRPYGVVLLRFDRPSPMLLDTLTNQTLLAAFDQPIRAGIVAASTGSWYVLDDCTAVRAQARREAVRLARSAAENLARSAGRTIDANAIPVVSELPPSVLSEDLPYLCGSRTLPEVPPPQIRTLHQTYDFPGRFVAASSVVAEWPAEGFEPTSYARLPDTLTSDHAAASVDATALEPGTIRSSVAVANDDVNAASSVALSARAVAIALARKRVQWLGSAVGLVPSALVRLSDPTLNDDSPSPRYAQRFNNRVTTSLSATFDVNAAPAEAVSTLEVTGTAAVKMPAERGRITWPLPDAPAELRSRIVGALTRAGVERASIKSVGSAIEADLMAPTVSATERIRRAVVDVTAASASGLSERVAYATDDCGTGARRALVAAVANAQAAAPQTARARGVTLGRVVAAADVGAPPEMYCGRHVLGVARPWLPPDPAADPIVTSRANVTLIFAVLPAT